MTIRAAITVSLVPEARGGPFVYWDDLAAAFGEAKRLGFDAVEIFAPGPDAVDEGELRRLCDETQLAVAAVGTGAGWVRSKLSLTAADESVRQQARAFVREMIEWGAKCSAPAIIGSMQGRFSDEVPKDQAFGYLVDALTELGEAADSHGQVLLYEPLNRYETNLACTLAEATALLDRVGGDSVKILADLFHMNIEEADPAEAIKSCGSRIGHIHFVDSNRRAAGLGHTDFAPLAAAIQAIDFDGYLSAEAFPLPDADVAASATIAAFRRWFPRG